MLQRNLVRAALRVGSRTINSGQPIIRRSFCSLPPKNAKPIEIPPEEDQQKNHTIETVLSEDPQFAYKHKIMTQIVKDKELDEPDIPASLVQKIEDSAKAATKVETSEPVLEKDEAFKEKKTTLWQKIKVAIIHLKHSFIDVWKDTKYICKVVWKNGLGESNYNLRQIHDRRRITMDIIKFLPYAVLIIVPGGELVFPVYVMMFPNSTPTQFLTANSLGERKRMLAEKQAEGYNLYVRSLPMLGNVLGIDSGKLFESLNYIQSTEGKEKDRQFYKANDFEQKLKSFIDDPRRHHLEYELSLSKLSSFEMEQLCKIFYFEYVPGTVWINLAYGTIFRMPFWLLKHAAKLMKFKGYNRLINHPLYRFKFTLDSGPLSVLKKYLLLVQLRFHMKQLRKQDRVLVRDVQELAKIPQMQRVDFARQRAIRIEQNAEIVQYVDMFWLPLSQRRDLPDDILIWIAVLRYKYTNILV